MNHLDFCEVVSIESLKARSELIKQSAFNYFDLQNNQKAEEKFPTEKQIQFARMNKEELPEHERAIIHLHFWEGMTFSEIAEFMNIPYTLVESIKDEAIHRLRLNYLIEFSMNKSCKKKPKGAIELVS